MNRRKFLLASGASLVLPSLESFASTPKLKAPKKMVFLGMGFGFTESLFPKKFGSDYEITNALKSVAKHKDDITIISNLWHKYSRNPHGGTTSYLTGANVDGTPGKRFSNTISCDQVSSVITASKIDYIKDCCFFKVR